MNNESSLGSGSVLFETALEVAADGVLITYTNGNIVWANHAYENLTGYTLSELKGNTPRLVKSGKQDASFYQDLWSTISAGKVWHGELWNKRKDGEIYLEEQSITPVKNSAGEITHFIAIKRDISKQYHLQNQINMAQRIEAIGQLTGGVAHNFNNKLASILGYVELASEEAAQYSNEELNEYLTAIKSAGELASDLVLQMIAFSRNDVNKNESINLSEIIKATTKILSSTLPSSIKTLIKIQDIPDFEVDPIRLHQMLLGLAVNASEAMKGKGVIVIDAHIEQVSNCVCNSCHQTFDGEYVVVSVHDTGVGIKPCDLEKIFLPFFTTKEFQGGTGMGLSALHGMLHDQKGHVVVDSKVGEYSIFNLYLPINDSLNAASQKEESEGVESSSDDDAQLLRPCHILVVDDEESVAKVLAELLISMGCEVDTQTNSKKALALYAENADKYDLVITDNSMPFLSGVELSEAIYDINAECPVVLVTGNVSEGIDDKPSNIKKTLTKPFGTKKLNSLIKSII